jgi:hypothetical protein
MKTTTRAFPNAQPFGEECCEDEVALFRDAYRKLYFQHTPFNELALRPENYLFIGRRGSGKSSLAHYFGFQQKLRNARCIDVDEPKAYEIVLSKIAENAADTPDLAMSRVVSVWEFLVWSLIFEELADEDPVIDKARLLTTQEKTASSLIREILKHLLALFLRDDSGELSDDLEEFLISGRFREAQKRALEATIHRPVIIAIDSLEKYSVDNQPMMLATAALVECASKFNRMFAAKGVHVKVFISAEIFPHLEESEIANPSKYVRNPIYLQWRPKDLMRLASWRLNEFFRRDPGYGTYFRDDVVWSDSSAVLDKIWTPLFSQRLRNGIDLAEATFPYVLRHTQLRPRQFIVLCNCIAKMAREQDCFPQFSDSVIVNAVRKQEKALASEVLNSYSKVYNNVANIVRAIERFPMVFNANELDRAAPATASEWPDGDYSPYRFRRILAELGIVGRVRDWNKKSGIIEADFEYALEDRLTLPRRDECVVHPMFFEKLSIKRTHEVIIYPFPDHPDFEDIFLNK